MSEIKKNIALNDVISSAIILILLASLAHFTQIFSRVDNLIYDVGQSLTTSQQVPEDIVIVAIDEVSLSQLGRWPWSREKHAALIEALMPEKPLAIGFDVVFSEPDNINQASDAKLVKSVEMAGNIVLPILIEPGRNNGLFREVMPFPALMSAVADTGRVHAELDDDSIVRSVYLHEGLSSPAWQLFSQAIINVAYHLPSKNNFNQDYLPENRHKKVKKNKKRISFLGPPGHFQTISYAQVLNKTFAKGTFNNKIVLVGATALGMNDMLSTPVSGSSLPMSGVEFHANALESIRANTLIDEAPFFVSGVLVILLSLVPLMWMPKLPGLKGFLATLSYTVLLMLLAGTLPKVLGIWVPPTAALFTLLLAYPMWSWRKLDSAQKYLDYELDYLNQHLNAAENTENNGYFGTFDRFDARITQVRNAATQLRNLQTDRKETLAFISHDIRAPLKAALLALEKTPPELLRLNQYLTQAHHLSEDFLQTSRAEVMQQTLFQELDIVGLTHQSIDAAYDAAKAKNIVLVRDVYEGSVWINGNFGLLERAMLNLILNAVKFAPSDTKVEVKCQLLDDLVAFSVTDYGQGIPEAEQAQLFKRFSRLEGHANTEGSGLGLYFVKTVADKHGGAVAVRSVESSFTTFEMQLPIVANQSLLPE